MDSSQTANNDTLKINSKRQSYLWTSPFSFDSFYSTTMSIWPQNDTISLSEGAQTLKKPSLFPSIIPFNLHFESRSSLVALCERISKSIFSGKSTPVAIGVTWKHGNFREFYFRYCMWLFRSESNSHRKIKTPKQLSVKLWHSVKRNASANFPQNSIYCTVKQNKLISFASALENATKCSDRTQLSNRYA